MPGSLVGGRRRRPRKDPRDRPAPPPSAPHAPTAAEEHLRRRAAAPGDRRRRGRPGGRRRRRGLGELAVGATPTTTCGTSGRAAGPGALGRRRRAHAVLLPGRPRAQARVPGRVAAPAVATRWCRSWRAVAGVATPALVYVAVNLVGDGDLRGWAIPAATDIAFALAVLAVVGSALPSQLRAFLLTLAVVDDLVVIVIIAVFYTSELHLVPLLVAVGAARASSPFLQQRPRRVLALVRPAVRRDLVVHPRERHPRDDRRRRHGPAHPGAARPG